MAESLTVILKKFSYENLNDEIKREMRCTARSAVQLGYMLKRMWQEHLWENVYTDFDTYLAKELGIDYTAARRLIQMNDKYSIGGNSAEISTVFEGYSKSLLTEMLNMTPEQEAKVTPAMTVKQVRQIKQDPVPEKVATSRTDDEEYKSVLIRRYFDIQTEHLEKLKHICRENNKSSEAAKAFQEYKSPYGATGGCMGNDLFYDFYSFAKGIDLKYHGREVHFTYIEFIKKTLEIYALNDSVYDETPKERPRVIDADFREVEKQPESQASTLPCDDCGYDNKGCCNYPDTPDDYCVLGDKHIEPQAKELFVRDHPESREMLPKLRNNEERKKWLCDYEAWGLWYRDDNIDVNYYKYDFHDGSRLIVAEYPQRESTWLNEKNDEYHFHLLQKNKQKYGGKKVYDTQYCNSTDCETYLVEFIKNLQKGEK